MCNVLGPREEERQAVATLSVYEFDCMSVRALDSECKSVCWMGEEGLGRHMGQGRFICCLSPARACALTQGL